MALTYEQRVLRVLQAIHDNPAADLSLDALSEIAMMSRFHWHRVFHAMTGETCAQAVRRIRLTLSATWLLKSDASVAEIAAACGYPQVPSFVRAFNDRFGVPPVVFRKGGHPDPLHITKARGRFTMFPVNLEQAPARRLAALHHTGPYDTVGPVFEKLTALSTTNALWPHVQGMICVHYDDPNAVDAGALRAHVGLWVKDGVEMPPALDDILLPATPCAVLHYKGPYTAIKVAYDFLYGDWLPASGQEPADAPPYEVYLNNPDDTPESELLTDIVLPLTA